MKRVLVYPLTVFFLAAAVGAAPVSISKSGAKPAEPPSSKNFKPAVVKSKRAIPRKHQVVQVGKASWYGPHFQGRQTASGEPFNMHDLTAAHRSLPLGTWVRVTDLHNGNSVVVRINDRGPVPESRVIDLSYEAASQLGLRAEGVAPVRLEIVGPETIAMALNAAMVN